MSSLSLPMTADKLIPHRLPMLLVDELLEVEGKSAVVAAQVSPNCPLVDTVGKLEDIALVELMAQSHATLNGYCDQLAGTPPRQGFLVGVKKVEWFGSAQVGDQLLIKIDTLAELDNFVIAAGEIWCGDKMLASGELKAWVD